MFSFGKVASALAVVAFGMGIAGNAKADCTSDQCSGVIDLIYPAPGDALVYIDPAGTTTALTCTDPAGKYVQMALDTDAKRATYQLLLAAVLAGKSVNIKLNASGTCVIQYVTMAP